MADQIITKRCSQCNRTKSLDKFNKDRQKRDSLSSACKQCLNNRARYRYNNCGGVEKKQQYQQTDIYKKNHKRAYLKWYKTKGKEWCKKYERAYTNTPKGKQVNHNRCKKWRTTYGSQYYKSKYKKNPNQFKAYYAVKIAIKKGILTPLKNLKCQNCNEQAKQYHHQSYEPNQRLIVIPLCVLCHKVIHIGQ